MDFFELVLQLEDELSDKKGTLFGKKVDVDKCQKIVTDLRRSFPEVIREAALIVGEREKYLSEAKIIYENTLSEADRQAGQIVSESSLYKRAEQESREMVEAAENRCYQLVQDTKKHLEDTFASIEHFLASALTMIRNNREELKGAVINIKKKE